jgi:hypothetical protein
MKECKVCGKKIEFDDERVYIIRGSWLFKKKKYLLCYNCAFFRKPEPVIGWDWIHRMDYKL